PAWRGCGMGFHEVKKSAAGKMKGSGQMVKHRHQAGNHAGQLAVISYACSGLALNPIGKRYFYS
ncbi:MAG: hypothetical protein ABIR56_16835, partial [Polaromonas sp.]